MRRKYCFTKSVNMNDLGLIDKKKCFLRSFFVTDIMNQCNDFNQPDNLEKWKSFFSTLLLLETDATIKNSNHSLVKMAT